MTEDQVPATFKYAIQVYEKLESKSQEVNTAELLEYGYPAKEGDARVKIYIGHSTKDSQSVGLAPSTAQHCMNILRAMECVTMLRTGSKIRPSVYLLNYKPTVEQYIKFKGYEDRLDRKVNPTKYDNLVNDIARLNEKVAELQRDNKTIMESVVALLNRVRALEQHVNNV